MGDQFGQIAGRLSRLEDDINRLKAQDRPLPIYDPGFPAFYSFIKDDFIMNNTGLGELGWLSTNGVTTSLTDVNGHPGVINKTTSAVINTLSYLTPRAGAVNAFPPMNPTENFDLMWIVRLNTNDANTAVLAGLAVNPSVNPSNNGIYIEKQAADTSWFGVTRSGGVQSRTAALAAVSTNFVKFRIRRVDASTIGFTIDSAAEVTATTNIPTTACYPFLLITNTAAADKNIDLDYFHMLIFGLSR